MSLAFHYHPLASFCWKPLIALYENEISFEPNIVDLGDSASRAAFYALWPIGKMPVLRDEARGETVGESTIVVEYLARHYPGKLELLPADPDRARDVRFWDRAYDAYVQEPMQKIVLDRLRPEGKGDPFGVETAKRQLREIYEFLEGAMEGKRWAAGDDFTLADCAAAPALFYASIVVPFEDGNSRLVAYLDRLMQRPSFIRVLEEAEPYFQMFPMETKPQIRRASSKG